MSRQVLLVTLLAVACGEKGNLPRATTGRVPPESTKAHSDTLQLVGDTLQQPVCQNVSNSYECARAIEQDVLARGAPGVTRRDASLFIHLTNGDSVTFRDSTTETATGVWHSYRGLLSSVPYHVLHVQFYEGDAYLLLSARTGKSTLSSGLPVPSPDGHYVAAANVDLEAEYSPTVLQVWRVDRDSLVLEWEHDFLAEGGASDSTWGPADLTWTGPTQLRVAREYARGERRGHAVLGLGPDGWLLTQR